YAGFGKLLLDAALFGDIYVIQAATLVAVFVAVLSQLFSVWGYFFSIPRFILTWEKFNVFVCGLPGWGCSFFFKLNSLQESRFIIGLILLAWLPLTLNVMLAGLIDDTIRPYLLLPAIPATLILYAVAVWTWRESRIAIVGVTLIFFWLTVAVVVPFLPLVDPD